MVAGAHEQNIFARPRRREEAIMGIAASKVSAGPGRPAPCGDGGGDDPHDEIELAFLGLWLGLARLRDQVRGTRDRRPGRVAVKRAKPPASKKPRRKAA